MPTIITVHLEIEVSDPVAFHAAALAQAIKDGLAEDEAMSAIGNADEPDLEECGKFLVDPGVSYPGCKILDCSAESAVFP